MEQNLYDNIPCHRFVTDFCIPVFTQELTCSVQEAAVQIWILVPYIEDKSPLPLECLFRLSKLYQYSKRIKSNKPVS